MSVGGKVKYDLCKEISPLTVNTLGKSWVDIIGDPAEALCISLRAAQDPKEWKEERKQCHGVKTPALKLAPIKLSTKHLEGLPYTDIWSQEPPFGLEESPNAEVYYSLEFWIGVEIMEERIQCFWFGVDGPSGDGGKETLACGKLLCSGEPVTVRDVHTLVDDVLDELAGTANTAIDLILTTLKAIVALVIIAAIAYVVYVVGGIVVLGLGIGGALAGGTIG